MNLFDIFESNEQELDEDLRKWFKDKWVRFGPDGEIRGDCARGDDSEGKPKCLPQSKAQSLGKKGRASAAARKRREDPNPERSGKAINVATKKKSNEGVAEGLVGDVVVHNYTKIPIDLEPGQAQIAGWGPNDEPLYRVKGQDGKEVKTWSKRRMLTIAKEQGVAEGSEGKVVFSGTGANGGKYEIIRHGDDFMIRANGKHIDSYGSLQRAMGVLKNEVPGLKQGVAEAINPDITNPEFSHQQQIGDYLYVARYWSKGLKITAYHGAKQIGYAELMYHSAPFDDFADPKTTPKRIWLESEWTRVDPKYQRQGIMSTMYAYAKMLGNSVKPSQTRSDDAKAAWKSWRDAGDAQHLTREGVAEGLDPVNKRRLYDLIELYRDATDPSDYYDRDLEDPDEVIAMIRSEFGDKIANQVEAGADKMHYPRHDIQRSDPLGWKKPVDRITKAGKMYKQDSDYMKNTIKARYKNSGKSTTEGVAEAFGPLPRKRQQIRMGRYTVDIERVGLDNDYISFAWHDSQGQDHYQEVPVGDLGSYDDLIDRIKDEIRYQERQYTDQGVAEGLNEMDKTQTPPGRDGDIDWTKKQIHLGPEHVIKAKDVAKHALKALDKTMKKRHADTPKKKGVAEQELDEACWKGYHKEGMKTMFGKKYPNCVKNTNEEQEQHSEKCPHCGGELVSEELINEKKDACYYKVKSRYKVWPSAYASGALVKCRKKGADSWGNKSEGVAEGSLNELSKDTLKSYAKKAVPDMQASQNKSKAEYSKAALAKDDETANKHYDAAKQAKDRTEKRMAGVAGAIKRFNKEGVAEGKDEKNAQLKQDYKTAMHWSENARSPQEREEYRRKALKIKNHLEKQYKQGVAEDQLDEKWSQKYKDSINCSNPKGFSQKAHCAGEKKNEDMAEGKEYYTVTGTDSVSLRRDFNMAKDRNGWYLREGATPKQKLEAFRAFGSPKLKEFNLAAFSGGTQTKGEDNVISPVGSQTRAQYKK